ncbi:MAG: YafY family protein [Pseudomonadota bacterium]
MGRSDRLVELIQILRAGRRVRAEDLARQLGVSLRTVYRDMEVLAASGIPVEGTRGLGYEITAAVTLPPLNLTQVELEALHLGLSVVGEGGDEELKSAARALSAKIDAVLPESRADAPKGFGFAVYPFADVAHGFTHMPPLRAAIRARQKVSIEYEGRGSLVIRPLQLDYWGRVWTVAGWCEESADFETLRVDRITKLRVLPSIFVEEEGKRLEDFIARQP